MAFNGSGVFVRIYSWLTDKNNSVVITASRFDAEDNGFAAGLSNCICRDGQSTITANIPFNGQKITGLGNGTNPQDAMNQQASDARYVQQLGGNAITPANSTTNTIDLEDGRYFYATVTTAQSWTFSNPAASGSLDGFILELTNGGSAAQTWPVSVNWPNGVAPALTASGTDVLAFITRNGGTSWNGQMCQRNVSP